MAITTLLHCHSFFYSNGLMLLISDFFDESLLTDIRTAMTMISKKWIRLFIFFNAFGLVI